MRADWTGEARAFIADATKDLPETATLADRRAALHRITWQFHGGTSWGKRIWGRECRRYYEQHGQPPIRPITVATPSAQHIKIMSSDIIFPYRTA